MKYIIDIIIAIIIISFAIIGWKKGFVKTITGFASSLVSTIVAILLYKPFAALMEKTPVFMAIKNNVYNNLIEKQGSLLQGGARLEDGAEKMIKESLGLPDFMSDIIKGWIPNPAEVVSSEQIAQTVSNAMAKVAIAIISLILIIILARIGLYFARGVLSVLTKLPVIRQVDGLLGFATGTLQGFLVILLVLTVMVLFGSIPFFKNLLDMINETVIAKFIYNNNPITGWVFP